MPYIDQAARADIDEGFTHPRKAGELNYVITKIIWQYIGQRSASYQELNDVIGVLECAKLELYRRIAAPYEDSKCNENGDVYV